MTQRQRRQRQPRKLRSADWDKHIDEIQQKRWLDTKPNRLIARLRAQVFAGGAVAVSPTGADAVAESRLETRFATEPVKVANMQ